MLFADEQWAEEQRRRTNAVRRREQPVGEQLLMGDDNDEVTMLPQKTMLS